MKAIKNANNTYTITGLTENEFAEIKFFVGGKIEIVERKKSTQSQQKKIRLNTEAIEAIEYLCSHGRSDLFTIADHDLEEDPSLFDGDDHLELLWTCFPEKTDRLAIYKAAKSYLNVG